MGHWLYAEFTKITTLYASMVVTIGHWEELAKFFDKLFGIKTWIVRRIGERRHTMSLLTVINGITLAEKDALALSAFMANLPEYLPAIQKQLADIQKAMADKSNPAALAVDVSTLLTDLSMDLSTVVPMIQNLLPTLKASAPPTPPTPPAAA
jgi:hypothetical protein